MKKLAVGALVLLGILLSFIATRPDEFHIERSTTISAPPDVVFAHLADFRKWEQWNPFEKGVPKVTKQYEGEAGTVGSNYHYAGEKMGEGRMTVKSVTPGEQLKLEAHFLQPFEAKNDVVFRLEQTSPHATRVSWGMTGRSTFIGKAMSVLINLNDMIGSQFEKGLADLKRLSEAEARTHAQSR